MSTQKTTVSGQSSTQLGRRQRSLGKPSVNATKRANGRFVLQVSVQEVHGTAKANASTRAQVATSPAHSYFDCMCLEGVHSEQLLLLILLYRLRFPAL